MNLKYFPNLIYLLIPLFWTACESGPPANSRQAQAVRGEKLFKQYCYSCHGQKGDGIMAASLKKQPADLTQILKSRRTAEFPVLEIARMIDGRKLVKAHGDREMPVWGEVFKQEMHLDEDQLKGKLGELIAYLISIQE